MIMDKIIHYKMEYYLELMLKYEKQSISAQKLKWKLKNRQETKKKPKYQSSLVKNQSQVFN